MTLDIPKQLFGRQEEMTAKHDSRSRSVDELMQSVELGVVGNLGRTSDENVWLKHVVLKERSCEGRGREPCGVAVQQADQIGGGCPFLADGPRLAVEMHEAAVPSLVEEIEEGVCLVGSRFHLRPIARRLDPFCVRLETALDRAP